MKMKMTLFALSMLGAACSQQSAPSPLSPSALAGAGAATTRSLQLAPVDTNRATTSTTHFTAPFTATALCDPAIGHIRFTGMIEGTDHTTVDEQGETHRTRQFRVKDLTATNLNYGTTYTVIGGAEMLSWNTQLGHTPGAASKSIHAGTLVFEPTNGGPKVIAHHSIIYVENAQGEVVLNFSSWRCVTSKR